MLIRTSFDIAQYPPPQLLKMDMSIGYPFPTSKSKIWEPMRRCKGHVDTHMCECLCREGESFIIKTLFLLVNNSARYTEREREKGPGEREKGREGGERKKREAFK